MNKEKLYEEEVDTCLVCKKQPVPESKQSLALVSLSLMLIIFSPTLALLTFLMSYLFSTVIWKCPLCKRDIEVKNVPQEVQENIIIRLGNCLIMVPRKHYTIFIVIATIAIVSFIVFYRPTKKIIPSQQLAIYSSWQSLAEHTGRLAMLDNEVHAKNQFEQYLEVGYWNLTGYFIEEQKQHPSGNSLLLVKMEPSQNPIAEVPDIIIACTGQLPPDLKTGDQIEFHGEFHAHNVNHYLFESSQIKKLSGRKELKEIGLFPWAKNLGNNLRNQH